MVVNGPAQTRSRPLSFHFEAMDQFKVFLDKWEFVQSFNHINEFALLGGDGLIAILTNCECSDGMSDIAFERYINVFHPTDNGTTLYSGVAALIDYTQCQVEPPPFG